MDSDDVMRLRAADMFIMLGDISFETGKVLRIRVITAKSNVL